MRLRPIGPGPNQGAQPTLGRPLADAQPTLSVPEVDGATLAEDREPVRCTRPQLGRADSHRVPYTSLGGPQQAGGQERLRVTVPVRIQAGQDGGGSIVRSQVHVDRGRGTASARSERERFQRACQVVADRRLDNVVAEQDDLGDASAVCRFHKTARRRFAQCRADTQSIFRWCTRRGRAGQQQTQAAQGRYSPHRSLPRAFIWGLLSTP